MLSRLTIVVALLAAVTACSKSLRNTVTPGAAPSEAELWQEPTDIATRDLFHGPGGTAGAPSGTTFQFVAADKGGYSPGYDVRDAQGTVWSVKLGKEAQPEVTTARVLWAVGFHQPPSYYVREWTLTGQQAGPQEAGRFRPELPNAKVIGDWSWYENPFVGSRPFKGLVVANLVMTNWDWKTSNNKIYEYRDGAGPAHRYVVRDVGASLGKLTSPVLLRMFRLRGMQGTRNDLEGFEEQGFIERMTENEVEFDYKGIYGDVVESVGHADVVWAARLLAGLTDAQWNDAFRAGGFTPEQTERYVRKIKSKIDEALSLGKIASR